jgi:hypothetical protein
VHMNNPNRIYGHLTNWTTHNKIKGCGQTSTYIRGYLVHMDGLDRIYERLTNWMVHIKRKGHT